jgi:hypothetical protein
VLVEQRFSGAAGLGFLHHDLLFCKIIPR